MGWTRSLDAKIQDVAGRLQKQEEDPSARRRRSSAVSRLPSICDAAWRVGLDQQPMQIVSRVGQEQGREMVSGERDIPPAALVPASEGLSLDQATEETAEGKHGGAWWSLSLDWLGYMCTGDKMELRNFERMQLLIQEMQLEDSLQFEK